MTHTEPHKKVAMITAEQLRNLNACAEQLAIFREEWPDGAEITLENCQRAAELGLDLDWAAGALLPAKARRAYEEATGWRWRAFPKAKPAALYDALTETAGAA